MTSASCRSVIGSNSKPTKFFQNTGNRSRPKGISARIVMPNSCKWTRESFYQTHTKTTSFQEVEVLMKKLMERCSYLTKKLQQFFFWVGHGPRFEQVFSSVFVRWWAWARHEQVQDRALQFSSHLPQEVPEWSTCGEEQTACVCVRQRSVNLMRKRSPVKRLTCAMDFFTRQTNVKCVGGISASG